MKKVFQGKIFSVWQWEQQLFDGSTATFEKIERGDYACAIGVLPDKQILLIEDTQPDRGPVITPAGGGIEKDESPEEGVRREFLEETGHSIGTLKKWLQFEPHHKLGMRVHIFIAQDLQKVSEPQLEAGERVKLLTYSFNEFLALGGNEDMRELRLRIILLQAQLDSTKRQALYTLLFE